MTPESIVSLSQPMLFMRLVEIKSVAINKHHQMFFAKVRIVNILGLAGHMISITTMQLCHCNAKTVMDNK